MSRHINPRHFGLAAALTAAIFVLPARPAVARGPENIADVAEQVIDAVVNVSTSQKVDARVNGMPDLPPGSPMEEFFDEFFKNRRNNQQGDNNQNRQNQGGQNQGQPRDDDEFDSSGRRRRGRCRHTRTSAAQLSAGGARRAAGDTGGGRGGSDQFHLRRVLRLPHGSPGRR